MLSQGAWQLVLRAAISSARFCVGPELAVVTLDIFESFLLSLCLFDWPCLQVDGICAVVTV